MDAPAAGVFTWLPNPVLINIMAPRMTGTPTTASMRSLIIFAGTGSVNPRQSSHTIGGTAGGYIIKDKLFAYGGTQFQRFYGTEQINPESLPDAAGVATLNALTGAVAAQQVALLNKYTTNNFYLTKYALVANQPTTTIDIGPQPGCPAASVSGGDCFVEEALFQRPAAPLQEPDTQWGVRVDYKPGEKDTFYYRYLHDRASLTPDFFANAAGGNLGLDTEQGGTAELGAGSWTHLFSGNTLNELRGSETRINFAFAPLASTLANPAYSLPGTQSGWIRCGCARSPDGQLPPGARRRPLPTPGTPLPTRTAASPSVRALI